MNSPARPHYSDARACIVHKSLKICEQCRLARRTTRSPFADWLPFRSRKYLTSCAHGIGQIDRLRGRPDITVAACISTQRKGSRPCFYAVRRNGYDWDFELIVRAFEMVTESAVWLKLDRSAVNCNLRLRMGAAIEDHLGID